MERLKDIHKIIDELGDHTFDDPLGIQGMIYDIIMTNIQVIIKFKSYIVPKIHDMTSSFNSIKLELDGAKKELADKSLKPCLKCPGLEKELSVLKKKQALNESRIKSIANILSRQTPGTEISQVVVEDDEDSDQSSVAKAYNLVSQVLGCDNGSDIEGPPKSKHCSDTSPSTNKNLTDKAIHNSLSNNKGDESENNLIIQSCNETDKLQNKENRSKHNSPVKTNENKPSCTSPVLGKCKKTPSRTQVNSSPEVRVLEMESDACHDLDYEDMYCIPPSPENVRSSSRKHAITPSVFPGPSVEKASSKEGINTTKDEGNRKKADFWQLKTTPFVDLNTSALKKQGSKLKQAKLSLACFPKKVDLSELSEFNGGIRVSQTSTQLSQKKVQDNDEGAFRKPLDVKERKGKSCIRKVDVDDDIVMDSPDPGRSGSKSKGSHLRLTAPGKKLLFQSKSASGDQKQSSSGCDLRSGQELDKKDNKNENILENSFDSVKKPSSSPKFKYRDAPVRKKEERKKLPGWDCDNCKKYYEAVAGADASDEELKKLMDRCSKHRDKNPVRVGTPPGFWDADFPGTEEIADLNLTHKDILPLRKKPRMKLNN